MQSYLIYWPLLVQVVLPMLVLILNGKRKAADRAAGTVNMQEAAMDNTAWSKPVALTSLNLANQSQLPVLFYVVCLVLASLNAVTQGVLGLAWAFVISRYIHAYAHVNGNNVPIRFRAFVFGVIILIAMLAFTFFALATV